MKKKKVLTRSEQIKLHNKRALFLQKLITVASITLFILGFVLALGCAGSVDTGRESTEVFVIAGVSLVMMLCSYFLARLLEWACES